MVVYNILKYIWNIEVRSARDEPTQGVKHWIGPTSPPLVRGRGGVAQPACSTWTWSMIGSFLQDEVILISYYSWDKRPISLICTLLTWYVRCIASTNNIMDKFVKFIPLYNYINILYYINIFKHFMSPSYMLSHPNQETCGMKCNEMKRLPLDKIAVAISWIYSMQELRTFHVSQILRASRRRNL